MKIKLLVDVPVGKEHGMDIDRELEVVRKDDVTRHTSKPRYWVVGDAGVQIGILPREAEEISDV